MKFTNNREEVLQNLGGKCVKCGAKLRLHLHHIKYEKDSVRWNDKSDDSKRVKEALEHPERFELLCVTCHEDYHHEQRMNQPKSKLVALVNCKICTWSYFPDEIKKHEETCDGKTPLDRNRENS